ncbi:aldo/keto reductase [Nibrella viscosa]|uniref:Aldo/keto reductase n=1 Tax=Nibrella viscosa TaxID=1084524 RepID=A0ABP8KJ86_9BACT
MTFSLEQMLTSRLGFGTWQFGGPNVVHGKPTGWGTVDEGEAIRAIQTALEQGINFIDTADSYGQGQAERILGTALTQFAPGQQAIICTKFGNRMATDGAPFQDFGTTWLAQAVENSLRRLKRDTIDVLLLHSPPDLFDWSTYDPAPFDQLVQAGKIRAYGVSSKSVYGARRVLEAGFGSVLEVLYNALDRRAEDVLFSVAEADRYRFIARVPLASGFLNPRYLTEDPVFPDDQYRHYLPERDTNWLLRSMRQLAFLNDLPGGMATSAIRFCLSHKAVSVVIPGMRHERQVQANWVAAQAGPLPPDVLSRIREAVPDVPDHWKPKA